MNAGSEDVPAVPAALRAAAVASVIAGVIHYAVIPEHRSEWWVYAVFFTLLGAFEFAWAALAWSGTERWVLWAGAAINILTLTVWTVSRTTGLPFGPDTASPEAIGTPDVTCCLAEAATTALALWVLRQLRVPTPRAVRGN